MRASIRVCAVGLAMCCLSGCVSVDDKSEHAADVLGPGWQCFVTATSFNAPGTVFRVGPDGTAYRTADLSQEMKYKVGPFGFGKVSRKVNTTLGLIADTLDLPLDVSAKATVHAAKTYDVEAEFDDVVEETSYDVDAVKVVAWFKAYPDKEDGYSYYVIRDAIAAKKIKYKLTNALVVDLGGEVKLRDKFDISTPEGAKELDLSGGYTLDKTYPERLRVCIRPEQLVQTSSALVGGGEFELRPVDGPVLISGYKP